MSEKITLACVTVPRLGNLKRNLPKILPFVDHAVIITGRPDSAVEEYLSSLAPIVEWHYFAWEDSFAKQYNHYLDYISEGWVLLCDDDELPSEGMLNCLRSVVDNSDNGRLYSCVEFTAHPIETDRNGIIVHDGGPVDYWRQIFFRYEPGMHYRIDLHQALVGYKNSRSIRRKETYYHIKSDEESHRNAVRNWFIAGVWLSGSTEGYKPKEWFDFREAISKSYPQVKTFMDLNDILLLGNIKDELKDYIFKIKDIVDVQPNNLYNELRAIYKYYFIFLHPEEKVGKYA